MLLCLVAIQFKSFIARAYARGSASSVDASLLADRFANIFRVLGQSVAREAAAAFGSHASTHNASFAADWFANIRGFYRVALVTSAEIGRSALAVETTVLAFGPAGE